MRGYKVAPEPSRRAGRLRHEEAELRRLKRMKVWVLESGRPVPERLEQQIRAAERAVELQRKALEGADPDA